MGDEIFEANNGNSLPRFSSVVLTEGGATFDYISSALQSETGTLHLDAILGQSTGV